MARIVQGLNECAGVNRVSTNTDTGTIVVHHESGVFEDIRSKLLDLGVILASITDLPMPTAEGKTRVAYELTDAIADLNRRLGLATNGLINLRVLVPVGFGSLAVVQLLRRGLEIGAAPWYVLAYAAFDSFVKLHYSREYSPAGGHAGRNLRAGGPPGAIPPD